MYHGSVRCIVSNSSQMYLLELLLELLLEHSASLPLTPLTLTAASRQLSTLDNLKANVPGFFREEKEEETKQETQDVRC